MTTLTGPGGVGKTALASAVPKSVTPARLRENLEAAELTLTPAELERIAALDQGYRMIAGTFWAVAGTPWTIQTIWEP